MQRGVTTTMIDEMHQKVVNSLQSMKGNAEIFKRLNQAASLWHTKLEEALDAQRSFFTVIDAVSQRAYAAPGMSDLGMGFNNLSDCAKGLSELQRDVARSLRDEVMLPLEARMSVDARAVQRMTKDYTKSCAEQAEGIHRAEKDLERLNKRVRKSPADASIMLQLRAAQRIVSEQTQELDALRAHALKRVLTEERGRYARVMGGVLDVFKVQARVYQRSVPALGAVISVCQPTCANPGQLPPDFNPMKKRGSGFVPPAPMFNPNHPSATRPPATRPWHGPPGRAQGGPPPVRRSPSPVPTMPPPPVPQIPPAQMTDFSGSLGPQQYLAKYPFHGQENGQLSFAAGHVIQCDGESDDNWQYGHNLITGKQGWFPVNFLDRHHADTDETTGAIDLPPVDYDDDGPQLPGADYDEDEGGDGGDASNFGGE